MEHYYLKNFNFFAGFIAVSRNLLFFLLIAFFSFSCQQAAKKTTNPDIELSEERLINVLIDVHLVESTLNYKRNLGQSFEDGKNAYYDLVFKNHGITPEIFKSNLLEYNSDPTHMEKIYEEVIARLSQMQSDALIEKTDSISD